MTVLEQISLCQRMAGSIKADVEVGKTAAAMGKIELLEGELGIFRQDYEPVENAANENHEDNGHVENHDDNSNEITDIVEEPVSAE